jgi:hypothetical protein
VTLRPSHRRLAVGILSVVGTGLLTFGIARTDRASSHPTLVVRWDPVKGTTVSGTCPESELRSNAAVPQTDFAERPQVHVCSAAS